MLKTMKSLIFGVVISMLLLLLVSLTGCAVRISSDGSKEVIPDQALFLKSLEIIADK